MVLHWQFDAIARVKLFFVRAVKPSRMPIDTGAECWARSWIGWRHVLPMQRVPIGVAWAGAQGHKRHGWTRSGGAEDVNMKDDR